MVKKTTPKTTKDEKKYKLYSLDSYLKNNDFIDKGYREYNIEKLINKLEVYDNGYHLRIKSDKNYILFGDCDGYKKSFTHFAGLLTSFLKKHYDINVDDDEISYTENNSVKGSFHYSIPKYYASCEKIKEIHEKFLKKYSDVFVNGSKKIIDTSVYCNKWFRYPNQSKGDKSPGLHIIEKGNMIDFVIEYIPSYSICINDKKYISNIKTLSKDVKNNEDNTTITMRNTAPLFRIANEHQLKPVNNNVKQNDDSDNSSDDSNYSNDNGRLEREEDGKVKKNVKKDDVIDDIVDEDLQESINKFENIDKLNNSLSNSFKINLIRNILDGYSSNIYDNHQEWTIVGMALKNESIKDDNENTMFEIWDIWSKKSEKYDGTQKNKRKWNSFHKRKDGYHIDKLLLMLKSDNESEHKRIKEIINAYSIVMNVVKTNLKSDCEVEYIEKTPSTYNGYISDKICPIIQNEHLDCKSKRYAEVSLTGTVCFKCTHHLCEGKSCPNGGYLADRKYYNQLFIQNNYYGDQLKYNNVFELFLKNPIIFDDNELNNIIIKTLSSNQKSFVDGIVMTNKNDFCYVNEQWYQYNGLRWIINENSPQEMLLNYTSLFTQVIEYINKLNINGVIKYRYIDEVNKIVIELEKPKKIASLIKNIQNRMTRDTLFNENMNLFAFDNGVYDFERKMFRESTRDDMISITCGYNYINNYTDKELMMKILSNIFEEKDDFDKFLKILYVSISSHGKNMNIMTFIKRLDYSKYSQVLKILKKMFGNFLCKFNDVTKLIGKNGMTDTKNIKKLINARVVVIDETIEITEKMFISIVIDKLLKYEKDDIELENNLKFHTICFYENKPKIDQMYEKNLVTVNISKVKNDNDELYDEFINDLFLFVLESIEIKNNGILGKKITFNDIKCKDEKYTFTDFFHECIIIDKNSKEKTVDVLKKYTEWVEEKNLPETLSHIAFNKSIIEHHKEIKYSKSMRFKKDNGNGDDLITSGYSGIKIKKK